jgi:hypothetical protein
MKQTTDEERRKRLAEADAEIFGIQDSFGEDTKMAATPY